MFELSGLNPKLGTRSTPDNFKPLHQQTSEDVLILHNGLYAQSAPTFPLSKTSDPPSNHYE